MKRYQVLIGLIVIALAIIISGLLISDSITRAGLEIAGQISGAIRFSS